MASMSSLLRPLFANGSRAPLLAESGIASISLARTDVTGTNEGNELGFEGVVTRTDGSTTTAQTIYFATDRRDTQNNTPKLTPVTGVEFLPQALAA